MHQNSFQSIRKKAFRKACSKVPLLYLFFQGLLCPPLLRPHLLRSAPGPEEVRRANTFVSYPGMQGTWEYSSGQRYVHGFERTLVLSAMFWCFRKRTGMKQPNLMSRAGIASAQPKRAPPGRQRKSSSWATPADESCIAARPPAGHEPSGRSDGTPVQENTCKPGSLEGNP